MKLLLISVLVHHICLIESITSNLIHTGTDNIRQLTNSPVCESGTKVFVHYFEVDIFIEPDTSQVCSMTDQIKLVMDINSILSSEVCLSMHRTKFTKLQQHLPTFTNIRLIMDRALPTLL
jgi:hypothetical protein